MYDLFYVFLMFNFLFSPAKSVPKPRIDNQYRGSVAPLNGHLLLRYGPDIQHQWI